MTSLEELKQLINYIHRRLPDEEKIDAAEHNRILKTLVDSLAGIGANVFLGVATPETIPEQSPATKCFYLATKKGNYPHFGDLTINSPLAVIYWNGFDWEKHEIEVSVNVNVDINDFVDLSNFAKLTADNEFVGNQKIIGSLEIGETRGKLRPAVTRNREMDDGNATVWDDLLKVIKTVKQVPDSKLFNEHAWEDWFNQALRTFDDVKFKSLQSTEFETKVKGWIIDAMGDAEFRKLILREGFKTADFIPGVVGSGTGMVGTEDFTTGKLTVRNYMEVMALAVARVFWRGGRDVHSPSGMKVNKVEEYDDYWRCYMETSEGQKNTCTIGAQMRCDKYGDGKEKYYWNLVMGIGEDYIDLSKTDRDGVDVPEVGDELAQFGHRTDPNLSWILVISSMMEDAGMTMYAGVNSYTLSGKWAISMGKDPNGSNRVGVFTKNGEFSDIIEGLEEKIQDAIVKTIDITASSQVFKYGPGFTGNPIPATITLTAMASKIAPESYQWQFLHGTGWVNIENATKKTLDVMPGDPVLFPSGTNVRSFRCVCNGDESFTDVFTLAKLADGAAGKPGTDGKGISSTAVTYQASTNGTTVPTGTWETTIPSVSANQYLWTRTIITYTDGTTSTSYSIGKMGATGATGAAGKGIKSTAVTYQASTSGTTVPTGTWGTTIPSVSANQYLWTRTIITYTDNTTSTSYSIGKMGANGMKGDKGDAGRGISSTAVTYQASTNGTTVPSGTWETTIPSVSANQYLWTRTIITYTDGTTSTSYSIGKMGATGATGAAGKGIKSTAVTYQASTSGTTVPTGTWGTTIPSVSANQYLWTRTIITYTDNTTSTSYSIGKMGANGMKGDKGDAGRGISSTAVTYQASTNGTTVPSGTWETTIPSVSANQYLWTRTIITYTDGTTSTSYSIGKMGATGATGAAGKGIKSTAVTYQASTSGTTVPTGTWGTTIPSVSANQYLWTRTIITYTDNTTSTSYSIGKMGATGAAGAAGKDACTVLLTNEAHTVACDANGNPLPGELAKATTKATAYKGTTKLTGVSTTGDLGAGKFSIGTKQETGGTFAWNGVDGVKCTTMTADTASCTFRVYLESASVYVEKTFIVTKAKSGENYWKTDVWLDASSYDADKWIPFTGTALQIMGYNRICVSVALNSGTKPTWSTHASGFSVDFDFDMQASGWGTTDAQTLIYADTFKFCPESPASCGQMTYSSIPVLYLRGGGKYHVKTDFPVTWTPRPDGYTWTSGSYTQSVSPQTSRPKPVGTSIIGRGVRAVANKYAVSSSNTTAPTSWSDTVPATTTTNRYLWNYEIITYTDGTTAETNKRVIGVHGATGATGVGIKSITEYYLASASASGVTASTSGWTTGMQVTTTTKKYLWNYEIVTYTDNSKYTSTPVIIGTHGATGDKGDTGAAGKGVKSTVIAYQASSSGTTTPTGTWSSSIPAVAAGQYLWTRTIITYTDNTTSTMYSVGRMGTNGTNGNAGNGVSSTAITYQASTSGITAPTGTWSSSIPTVAAGSYLWTRTIISYTNGTSSTIYSVGKMGNTGAQGVPGESINGKMLYKDPEFKLGWNGVNKYSNSVADVKAKLVVERIAKPSDAPTQSGYCLKVTCKAAQTPGYGGVYQSITSRANAVFVQKIIAKIPVGYKINTASNSMGTGYTDTWLTPTEGTGKYTTYLRKVVCGATGTFSAGGHVYITGNPAPSESVPLEWYIASMTCFDQTSDGYADIEIVTKDSFAVQLGFTSFEALKANALTKGPLIKAGLINADVIDVNTLAANNAFIDKLRTNILKANVITANMISVIGFTFADNKIIGGKDFGVGPGVKVTSTDSEKSFKAYKDASNYISMYYNSASDWGLKGVVGGAELLKLGITNKLGPFAIEGSWLRGSNLALSGSQLNFSYSGHQVYVGSHPDMTTAGNAKLGTFMLSGGGYGGLGSNKQVALIAGAPNNGNSYAMAVTQGMLKIFSNVHIVSGVFRAYMTGTNPGITLGNEYPNIICLYGTGNRKKVNLYAGMEIGSHFFITSEASQGFDVLCTGSERFYRNGNTYVAVQSSGQDTVLVMKTDTYKWTACQLPINWLGTWNP